MQPCRAVEDAVAAWRGWRRWSLWLLLMLWLPAMAEPVAEVVGRDAWIEEGRSATIEQVAAGQGTRFSPVEPDAVLATGPGRTLWLRLRLRAPPAAAGQPPRVHEWGLDIPVPLLDYVALYQRDTHGHWEAQAAGDSIAVEQWRRPGRYPSFELALLDGAPQEVFLQVRHADPIGFPLALAPEAVREQDRQIEYLLLGMMLGTLLVLAVSYLIHAAIHRDASYAWYAGYALAMSLTVATVTGISAHLLWTASPLWADAAQGALPVMMSGVHVLFMRHICSVPVRSPRAGSASLVLGVGILLLAVLFLPAGGQLRSLIVSFSMAAAIIAGVWMAVLAWRRYDSVGGLVLLAYLPLAIVVAVALCRLYGLLAATWLTLDASAAAAAAAVPLLLLALSARSRDRLWARTRVNKLTQQDALTGLLSADAFDRQLQSAVSGALMRREPAAVVLVEIVNLRQIRRFHGDAMAEQCLLRSVIKLQRVIRESDPAGRIATNRFAVIFEGMDSREALQERMVRLVASGLVPARGATLEMPLQFHVGCVMLGERLLAPALLLRELDQLLRSMSRRTRRPVRFVAPQAAPADVSTVDEGQSA